MHKKYQELKLIAEKHYGKTFSDEEIINMGDRLLNFFRVISEMKKEQQAELFNYLDAQILHKDKQIYS